MRRVFLAALLSAFLSLPAHAIAGQFASTVTEYSEGTFATVGGQHFINTPSALGKPPTIVDEGTAFASILSPFAAHYAQDQLVAIGRTGSITMRFAQAVAVTGAPQIGVFTSAALFDSDWPNGSPGADAHTSAMEEYGAERTAIVEVGSNPDKLFPLGRYVFDDPNNAYSNATDPYDPTLLPNPATLASYDQPFDGSASDFNNDTFAQVLAKLNGSAGGTWISVPTNLGIGQIQYVRLRDPLWRMPDGSLVNERPSKYFPPPNEFIKPADLFIDAAVLIPEPGMAAMMVLVVLGSLACRRR